jgi:Skp family chaperone for outer membrane proteins
MNRELVFDARLMHPYNPSSSCLCLKFAFFPVPGPSGSEIPDEKREVDRLFERLTLKPQRIPKEFSNHMKRSFAIAIIMASGLPLSAIAQMPATPGLAPQPAAAPPAAPAGPARIAVIAFQLAVAQTNEGQRDFADLQKKYAPKEATLKTLSDEIDNLTKQLQTQGATLSEAERANKAKTIDEKKKQLDRETEDLRNDGQQDMQDLYNSLASKVYDSMQSYAEKQGFTLVLDISQQQSPVLFASDGTNITKEVIEAYNVKSGVPAPAAESGEGPKPKPAVPSTRPPTQAPKPPAQH